MADPQNLPTPADPPTADPQNLPTPADPPTADPPNPDPPDRHLLLWLPWAVVGLVVVVAAVLITVMLVRDLADAPDTATTPSAAATEPEATESTEPADDEPTDEPTEPVGDGSSLTLPRDYLPESGISGVPLGEELEDGDYFGHLTGIDVGAGTVSFDVEILYTGQAAIDYLTATDPHAENPPPNGIVIVNKAERVRTLPLSPDARIWDWCFGDDLGFAERSLAEWAAAPSSGETSCDAGAELSHGWSETYWFDVRAGVVMQVVGQYLP